MLKGEGFEKDIETGHVFGFWVFRQGNRAF